MLEERWQAAYDVLTNTALPPEPADRRAHTMNERAWCLAQLGRAPEAVTLAAEALSLTNETLRPHATGTLGAAHHLAGNHPEAVRLLEQALACQNPGPLAQAARPYYLGEALNALGRTAEACGAYQRAIAEAGFSRHARLASERLQGMPAAPAR